MADARIENIYGCSKIISVLRRVVSYIRLNNAHFAKLELEKILHEIEKIIEELFRIGYVEAEELHGLIKYVLEEEPDLIVRGDVLENAIIPMLEKYVQSKGLINESVSDEYMIESTASGFLTLKNRKNGMYLHSNNDPMNEARIQIEEYCSVAPKNYCIFGCGLGYHAYQLYLFTEGSVKIKVYERQAEVAAYARKYGVLDWIPAENLEVHIEESVEPFLTEVSKEGTGAFLYQPSIECIEDSVEKNTMITARGQWQTRFIMKKAFELNLWRNLDSDAKLFSEFDTSCIKKDIVIVAAGPSLDENMQLLKRWQGNKTIIAVGTVFAKLIRAGIRPDLVAVLDPQERTRKQIQGVEEENVPLIMDAGANFGFSRDYKGPKFLIFTNQSDAEKDYAEKNKIEILPSGGTVTSMAIILAAKLCAKNIFLMGVDLAYPGGISHAAGTMDRRITDTSEMMQVQGVFGKTVYTTHTFQGYLRWIEEFVKNNPQIRWYNMSDVGARIAGTIEIGARELSEDEEKLPEEKISVIVHCKNSEKTIERCVDSLLNQTLPKEMLEVILVDEGSKDSTWEKLNKLYEQNPDRITVCKMKGEPGIGEALNKGLELAMGSLVGFADAGDYAEPDMYEWLYRSVWNSGAELAVSLRQDERENDGNTYFGPLSSRFLDLSKEEHVNEILIKRVPACIFQCLYRKEFLQKIRLQFPEDMEYDDNYFVSVANYYVRSVAAVADAVYHHPVSLEEKETRDAVWYRRRLKMELQKFQELKRRGAYEYNKADIDMQFIKGYFTDTIAHLTMTEEKGEVPKNLLSDMQKTIKKNVPDWKENILLNKRENKGILKICRLIDYPFEKGDLEELKCALKEIED